VVIVPFLIPNASSRTLARGARQLVVQDALETIRVGLVELVVVDPEDDGLVDLVLGRHGEDHPLGPGVEVLLQ
jgi:hypothetical protein